MLASAAYTHHNIQRITVFRGKNIEWIEHEIDFHRFLWLRTQPERRQKAHTHLLDVSAFSAAGESLWHAKIAHCTNSH